MIVLLVELSEFPTTSPTLIREQLQRHFPALQIRTLHLPLNSFFSTRFMPPLLSSDLGWDHWVEQVLAEKPHLIIVDYTLWNAEIVRRFCIRIRQVAPSVFLALGGIEAYFRQTELLNQGVADFVFGVFSDSWSVDLSQLIKSARRSSATSRKYYPTAHRKSAREGAINHQPHTLRGNHRSLTSTKTIAKSLRSSSSAVNFHSTYASAPLAGRLIVEPWWGGQIPLVLYPYLQPDSQHPLFDGFDLPKLSLDEINRLAFPLLEQGHSVHLMAPMVTSRPEAIKELLHLGKHHQTQEAPRHGLWRFEVLDAVFDESLVQYLNQGGAFQFEIVPNALLAGQIDPDDLRLLLHSLNDGISFNGSLLYGESDKTHRDLLQAVDQCVFAGIENLKFYRLIIPPWSSARRQAEKAGSVCSTNAPYEILHHSRASYGDILRSARFASTYDFVKTSWAGTGLLRGLASELGSIALLIEEFGSHLLSLGYDPLYSSPPFSVDHLFLDYLREQHHFDIAGESLGRVRLLRSPTLALRWLPDGRRLITDDATGRIAHLGTHALAILDQVDEPKTNNEICEAIIAEAPFDKREKLRQELRLTLEKLTSMSFLVPAQQVLDETSDHHEPPFTCLEEFDFHYRMLADTLRVDAYRQAIQQVVQPGCHAIEIGTGTGILSIFAAQAGARVTSIERFSVLNLARAIAEESSVGDRIQFIRGRSDLVTLKEAGDVLITELVGNRILNEGLLEVTLDARRRLLKPNAQLIPQRIEILAQLGRTDRFLHLQDEFQRLGKRFQVSFEPLWNWFQSRITAGQVVWELEAGNNDFIPLSDEVSLIQLDLGKIESADFSRTLPITLKKSGEANAVTLAFRLELQPGIHLTTSGDHHEMHWNKPVFMLQNPLQLAVETLACLTITYQTHGEIKLSLQNA